VSVIRNATLDVIATIRVARKPWHVTITPDGDWAYVSNSQSNSISIIDTHAHLETRTLPAGDGPFFSVVDPTGTLLFVSNAEDTTLSVVDLNRQTVPRTIHGVGNQPFDLIFD
jgi:YVTN family beta-propeller protein